LVQRDSADGSIDTGPKVVKGLLRERPDVLIGAGSSAATTIALGQVTEAGVLMISPSSTLPELSALPDRGLFWRTAPSDALQGGFIGSQIVADGHTRVAVVSRRGFYGPQLTDTLTTALSAGGAKVVVEVQYDADAVDFASTVAAVKSADPDAIVLIGADESAKVVHEMVQQGIGPN
jgi:branched-chain amino acid transport system substrate-binding protein